jgi:hypothetical protein
MQTIGIRQVTVISGRVRWELFHIESVNGQTLSDPMDYVEAKAMQENWSLLKGTENDPLADYWNYQANKSGPEIRIEGDNF